MQQKLGTMLSLQDSLNRHINPDWVNAGYEWYRAIWVECAELMDHYGWKWWKAQSNDLDQIRLELIDIWHFGLSAELVLHEGNLDSTATAMAAQINAADQSAHQDFRQGVDELAAHALNAHGLSVPVFLQLLAATGASFSDLFVIYVGKNVLNRFRQDHGYKDGSYKKVWNGREDNEHLSEVTRMLDTDAADFQSRIYEELELRYH